MFQSGRFWVSLLSAVLAFSLIGCGGPKGVPVNGKLVFPSNLKLVETDDVQISFVPESQGGQAAVANYSKNDQSFVVNMGKAKGVLPGKYKVVVKIVPYPGMAESQKREPLFDPVNQKYTLDKTPLTAEVTAGGEQAQSFTIDLDKGKVTKS